MVDLYVDDLLKDLTNPEENQKGTLGTAPIDGIRIKPCKVKEASIPIPRIVLISVDVNINRNVAIERIDEAEVWKGV